jgi:hypothetical protein
MPGKKVPECCSGLRPSGKELPEWSYGTFHHKNTLDLGHPKIYRMVSSATLLHFKVS